MKKLLLAAISLCISLNSIWAQDIFEKGDKVIGIGYGLGNTLHGAGYSRDFSPISATFEYGLKDGLLEDGRASIGVGGYLGVSGDKFKYKYADDLTQSGTAKLTDVVIGGKLNFHYQFIDKLDTYTGIMLGYDIVSKDHNPQGIAQSQVCFTWNAGAKYYIFDNFAVMGEIGWGAAILNLGLAYNIKNF
ncbi:MAG: hypothetical protein ACK5MK_04790 [Dysgonomonas sp.]